MTTHDHTPTSAGLCADDLTPTPADRDPMEIAHGTGAPSALVLRHRAPTPAGDDQREALARHFMEWFGGEDQPVIDDYLTADAALAWFAARPPAPTVTVAAVVRAAATQWPTDDTDGPVDFLAALGIEVTP